MFKDPAPAPAAELHTPEPWSDDAARAANLKSITLLLGLSSALLVVPLLLVSSDHNLALVSALFSALSWACLGLLKLGKVRQTAMAIVFIGLLMAVAGILAMGTVRAAVGFVFVGAVAGAGIFLDRKGLIVTVISSVTALALLTWLETQGLLREADSQVGWASLLVHVSTLVVVARIVYYSRSREHRAMQRFISEFEQRRHVELERDLSNDRFASIFRTSPSPMIAQSALTGHILEVNPAFERTYGYRQDQVLGRPDQFLWADQAVRQAYRGRLLAEKRVHLFETDALHADGSTFRTLISSELGAERGDPLVMTTIIDISEQACALEKLQRSEERFSKAFNFSPLNMAITRISDDAILEVNRSSAPAQGLDPDQMRGRSALETGFWLSEAERRQFMERLHHEGHIFAHEMQMRHVDGHLVNSRVWAEPIEIDGEPCMLSCTVNIDDEKQREALLLDIAKGMAATSAKAFYSALTRHMALALKADTVVLGELKDGPTFDTLSAFRDGVHIAPVTNQTLSRPCLQALNQSDPLLIQEQLPAVFCNEPAVAATGYQAYLGLALRDEQERPIGILKAMWKHPIKATPELLALMAIYASRALAELLRLQRDREIQRLNEQLEDRVRQRTADLQKLNAELDSFAYSVSHDLKTPLRSIDGFTQLLGEQLEGRLSTEENRLFARILTSTHRMSQLIADLLALARVSQGDLARSHLDLSGLAEQVLLSAHGRQPERAVRWQVTPGLHCLCDPHLSRIALENLLGNAIKYTREQPSALIEVGQWHGTGAQAGAFYVRDNGVGFSMDHSDKLFKPFQRLHMPSAFDGTGIGLATVRRIVERHGGFIMGHGQEGVGAIFVFAFSSLVQPPLPQDLALMLKPSPASE